MNFAVTSASLSVGCYGGHPGYGAYGFHGGGPGGLGEVKVWDPRTGLELLNLTGGSTPVAREVAETVTDILGLNPVSDGEQVRLPIPPLTQDRRKDLVKMIKKLAEEAKVALRTARREANETLKEFTDSGDIAEDDERQGLKKVQDLTDKFTAQVDDIMAKKEKEIMEV